MMGKCKFIDINGCHVKTNFQFTFDCKKRLGDFAECMTSPLYGNFKCLAYNICNTGVCYDFVKSSCDNLFKPYSISPILSYNIVDGVDTKIISEQQLYGLARGTILKITDNLAPGGVAKAVHSFLYLGNGLVTGVNFAPRPIAQHNSTLLRNPNRWYGDYKFFFLFSIDALLLGWNVAVGNIFYANNTNYCLYANNQPISNYFYFSK